MSKRILVVDDHDDLRRILKDRLTHAGYEVIEATTGEAGIEAAETERPDLILMDMQLPGFDGYETTIRIRANPKTQDVPIIAVTSFALPGDEAKATHAGCDGYITKPFSPRVLLAKVQEFLP